MSGVHGSNVLGVRPDGYVQRVKLALACTGALLLVACSSSPSGSASGSTASIAGSSLTPKGETISDVVVERVVDGDTFKIRLQGADVSVRMIGLDTPETVKPNTPVACFGPEASAFTKSALSGKKVTLEFDDSQGQTDKYGRLLAYVWVPTADGGSALFNESLIANGFAEEVRYAAPYAWESVLRSAEDAAQQAGAGLWSACP